MAICQACSMARPTTSWSAAARQHGRLHYYMDSRTPARLLQVAASKCTPEATQTHHALSQQLVPGLQCTMVSILCAVE